MVEEKNLYGTFTLTFLFPPNVHTEGRIKYVNMQMSYVLYIRINAGNVDYSSIFELRTPNSLGNPTPNIVEGKKVKSMCPGSIVKVQYIADAHMCNLYIVSCTYSFFPSTHFTFPFQQFQFVFFFLRRSAWLRKYYHT